MTRDDILKALRELLDSVVSKLGRMPSWIQLRRETNMADKTFLSRFGENQNEVYQHYREWLRKHPSPSKNLKIVDAYFDGHEKSPNNKKQIVARENVKRKWQKTSGREYGPPLNFRNLIYEPINEQGVVFLFGMISENLGFSVESIGTEFPDCEAKRNIVGRKTGSRTSKLNLNLEAVNMTIRLKAATLLSVGNITGKIVL